MAKLGPSTDLESVLENRSVMLRFRRFLDTIYSVENMTFWLEAEIYKYLPEEALIAKAKEMYQQYFSGSPDGTPINLDDMSQELELKHRMLEPARDTFLNVQGIVWGLLKFECFARFKTSDMYHGKLTKQEETDLKTDSTVELLDQFLEIRKQEKKGKLKAPKMPVSEKELDLDDNLYDQPDIEEMFEDEDLMLAFREYLYHTHIQENLAFWLETELYRRIDDSEERARRAQEIVDKFCKSDSPYIINCEESLLNKIIKEVQKRPLPNTFRAAQKMTWRGLKNEWFPQFCVSDMYKLFDKQELKYTKSSQGRDRSDTLIHYDEIVSLKSRLEAVSRDFVAEIPVDDTITPLPAPARGPTRVVPVQVKTGSESAPLSKAKSPKDDKHVDKDKHKAKSSDNSDHRDSEKLKKDKKEKKEKDDRIEKLQKTKEKGSHGDLKTPPDSSRSS